MNLLNKLKLNGVQLKFIFTNGLIKLHFYSFQV